MQYIKTIPHQGVRRVVCRGTSTIFEPFRTQNWTGKEFKEHETQRLNLAKNPLLMKSRGTDSIKANDLVETSIPYPKGHYIITNRGTCLARLR